MKVKCRFTGKEIDPAQAIKVGATVPGVIAEYFMEDSDEARQLKKESEIAFHKSEANCNTCVHLKRVRHDKCKTGTLKGICGKTGDNLSFHPEDPLFKTCYKSRWDK